MPMSRSKKPKSRKNLVLRICIFAFVAFAAIQLVDMQIMLSSRRQELEELQVALEAQRLLNKEVQRQVRQGVDEEYIERTARELDYVDPDEIVFIDMSGS